MRSSATEPTTLSAPLTVGPTKMSASSSAFITEYIFMMDPARKSEQSKTGAQNGQTYINECQADRDHQLVDYKGKCRASSDCACSFEYRPVCGDNGVTYGNPCSANCAGVAVRSEGLCDEGRLCDCPKTQKPVCGIDRRTYENACQARCANVEIKYKSKCRKDESCNCLASYNIVCGDDGVTYKNECFARCEKTGIKKVGECPDDFHCKCKEAYDPVCGSDNRTYKNQCVAGCNQINQTSKGRCEGQDEPLRLSEEEIIQSYQNCSCPDHTEVVCANDGRSYINSCVAKCHGVMAIKVGKCSNAWSENTSGIDGLKEKTGKDAIEKEAIRHKINFESVRESIIANKTESEFDALTSKEGHDTSKNKTNSELPRMIDLSKNQSQPQLLSKDTLHPKDFDHSERLENTSLVQIKDEKSEPVLSKSKERENVANQKINIGNDLPRLTSNTSEYIETKIEVSVIKNGASGISSNQVTIAGHPT
jgi:hypothetical protein